ncbi:S8 family peptidase [Actinocrispum wychmicini]|uniref:Subtilase family protein n=1 Tax=Actinocrispum wychmicini TaxID=1213861 RepID=A0A4R2J1N2_9PSEU|nr:S8 family serine peptidase [Actinocrispum wychmicini]TCO50628.1 subtilase family protein [Actinocrispum wychmicini]
MVVKFVQCDVEPFGPDDGSAAPEVPQHLLARHGARVLNPIEAVVAPTEPTPRSTAYRIGTILVPQDVARDRDKVTRINKVLAEQLNLELVDAEKEHCVKGPRPVAVRTRKDAGTPVKVDGWQCLQVLRAHDATKDFAGDLSVEHLLFGTVDIGGTPWEASGAPTGGGYVRTGTTGRIPVALFTPPPPRQDLDRRPVIAILDTGIGPNDWFDLPDRENPPAPDGFLQVFPEVQDAIRTQEETTADITPTQVLRDYWDAPVTDNPLVGEVDKDTGHGTFIAGIIRQVAPDANVLSIRVLHSDGVAYEGDVLLALWRLVERVENAQNGGDPEDMVDVVSLSLGYFDETADPQGFTGHLVEVIDRLRELGVLVVAAAGNDATTRRFYPAALAERPENGLGAQVLSVGALNPNTTKAVFSNEAPWVRSWATGAAVVSTFPKDVQGSVTADLEPAADRASLDADDYRAGFAVWDGTSFAAPLAAAEITAALIRVARKDPSLGLKAVDRTTAAQRVRMALQEADG